MTVAFDYAVRSDVGLVRKNNQDSGYAGTHLLVLADGMGGPAGGDIASSIAVAHLAPLDSDSHGAEDLLNLLRQAIAQAHGELVERSSRDDQLSGLGTTCIALLRSGNKLAMVHIGDSRAYLLRQEELTQVTTDHSFVQYLIDTGQLTKEQAENHPQRSVILRVLGDGTGDITLDESIREAIIGDRWLLCSDGLSGTVSDQTIAEVLSQMKDPGQTCEELISLALRAGAPDNVTCVVADIVQADPSQGIGLDTQPQVAGAAATDRLARTRGADTPSGRAAALNAATAEEPVGKDDRDESIEAAPKHLWKLWGGVLALASVSILALTGWAGYSWSQTRYYVMADKSGKVQIHQGIPQNIGPWQLSHPLNIDTGINANQLDETLQIRLATPVLKSSLAEAKEYVNYTLIPSIRQLHGPANLPTPGVSAPGLLPPSSSPSPALTSTSPKSPHSSTPAPAPSKVE